MYREVYMRRKERKMRQKEIAKKLGLHPQTYHRKESGQVDFTISEGLKLSIIFECTLDDLFEV